MLMKIETENAPKAIGPYSQGISAAQFVFTSGQIPLDPVTGNLVEGDIRKQTHRVIDSLEAILAAAGCSLGHVVRVDIFLKNLKDDFAAMNEEYAKRFEGFIPPARQTVEVSQLPKGADIEISCIAIKEGKFL